ncbi:hypothetical protein CTEN210_03948 [Chaetoceros tenuissimus]|uniref:Uncharacterized protein n=1 Tax=Chaetoceros tenuissimus TaxID=426638 RepID=A0AAD3CKY4_9STRA|nr:hypothetical protein CTEN210_03948 [Chaetoceros tenuissimus]
MSDDQPLKKFKPSKLRLKLKIKEKTVTKTESIPCTSELIDLLTQLNEGKPLDLTLIASIHEAASRGEGFGRVSAKYEQLSNTKEETLMMHLHKIFQEHIGKSPEVVVGNALRIAREDLLMEEKISEVSGKGALIGDERQRQLNHPELHQFVYGPNLDGKVWLALFLGKERADKLLDPEKTAPLNSLEILENSNLKARERVVFETLSMEVSWLSIDVLMFNILKYIRDLANATEDMQDIAKLIRFSVLYGLDGVMKDILRGRYGDVGYFSTVNSFLVMLDDTPIEDTSGDDFFSIRKRLYWPLYALGALVGHTNIVTVALNELGAIYDAPSGHEFSHRLEEGMIIDGDHTLPSELFHWVFHKNMPDMVECLVKECGFQFRWIDHKKYILKSMFKTLFLVSDYPRPPWDGEDEDMFFLSSGQRRKASYKAKMKMLDLLISLGFPFELFFPTEPLFEKEELVRKNGKLQENTQEWSEYFNGLTKAQRKAIIRIDRARGSYNRSHSYKDALTSGEFYKKLKTRWEEGQETAQISKLDEYEALDSRWRNQTEDGDESSDDEDAYYY